MAGDSFAVRYRCYGSWETAIPLLPWTALVYLSLNLMLIPMLFTFPTPGLLLPVLATLMVELLVAALVFYLWPLEDGFADPQVQGPLGLARRLALRHNYFPSLHVALAFTGAATMGARWGRGPSLVLYVWASLIALSTLTTHQHHLIDVVGGILLALAAYRAVYLRLAR